MKYSADLQSLDGVYLTAHRLNVTTLARAVERIVCKPLLAIGSGGSFSAASLAAFLHELGTGAVARAVTPLEFMDTPLHQAGVLFLSASGRNKDICASFSTAAKREVRPLVAIVLADDSPLHALGRCFQYSDVISCSSVHFRDGFLAVASLIATGVMLLRAYREVTGDKTELPDTLASLIESSTSFRSRSQVVDFVMSAVSRPSISVLHTASLKPAGVDLESRFVEAALGHLHVADLRNFGHGRHNWFAKRAANTGVLALVGDGQEQLGNRTLELLPADSPVARCHFRGPRDEQALAGLIVGMHVADAAARAVGLDPARPRIPPFGRKLYHLGPRGTRRGQQGDHFEVAVRRKAPQADLTSQASRARWRAHYERAITRVESAALGGIVVDYDGTLCDARHRFGSLSAEITTALTQLAEGGAVVGIATGRGGSAGEALRTALPQALWERFVVGYYNGSVVEALADAAAPQVAGSNASVQRLEEELLQEPTFATKTVRSNTCRVSIYMEPGDDPVDAVRAAERAMHQCELSGRVTMSSHSIDVILDGASKLRVVATLKEIVGVEDLDILRIGDQGRAPGNDADLLDHPLGLTVDRASPDPARCWGFAPPGIIGTQATLYYLGCLTWSGNQGRLRVHTGKRKATK